MTCSWRTWPAGAVCDSITASVEKLMSRMLAAMAALGLLLTAFDAGAAGGPSYKLDA